ncbi:hypothetical protein [Rhizobium ruizarguesonis]|uniref:hypothetical protein n=1 Tax=Rhizobium ruizarguesonis TaxID=2081791 RepID=UPI0013EE9650|nr:hypothetical protein [Rhizobium ruizarguesonis]
MLIAGLRNLQPVDGFADVCQEICIEKSEAYPRRSDKPADVACRSSAQGFAMNIRRLPHPTAGCLTSFTAGLANRKTPLGGVLDCSKALNPGFAFPIWRGST